jgi:prevent-host-death family protein
MDISAKELRAKPGKIIEQAVRGTEVVITIRGKKVARLIPYQSNKVKDSTTEIEDEIFGMWADKNEVEKVNEYVRSIRKGRSG